MQDPGVETRSIALQAAATVMGGAGVTHPEMLRKLVDEYLKFIRTGDWPPMPPVAES